MIGAIKEIGKYAIEKEGKNTLDPTPEIMENTYNGADFLYNNGLINIFRALKHEYFKKEGVIVTENIAQFKHISVGLSEEGLKIDGSFEEIKEFYRLLRGFFYSFIFEKTNNKKGYYDTEKDDFIMESKLSVPLRFQRIGKINHLLPYLKVSKEKFTEIKERFEEFKKNNLEIKNEKIQHGKDKNLEVFVWLETEELGKRTAQKTKDIKKGEKCVLCNSPYTKYEQENKISKFKIESTNLVFDFGSNTSFKDMRSNKQLPICFMCDLIYKYGLLYNYFNLNTHFIVSMSLFSETLRIKRRLCLSNKAIAESEGRSNFVKSDRKPFSVSGEYSELLLLLYKIYLELIKEDPDDMGKIIVYYFTATGTDVSNGGVYTKTSYLAEFFRNIDGIRYKTTNKEGRELKRWFLGQLINYMYQPDLKNAKNLLREEFCSRILNQQFIDDLLIEISYYKLQKEEANLNLESLYEFNKKYNNLLKMDEKIKYLHEAAKEIGEAIGSISADIENKNILYQLREIEKYEGLTEFFKDLEYDILKIKEDDKKNKARGSLGNIKEKINELLRETSNENVRTVRNYLAIYAIQKYLSTQYAKSKSKKGGN